MRIIRRGKNTNITKRFRCRFCCTVFEADKGEYEEVYDPRDRITVYMAKCPSCEENSVTSYATVS